MNQIHSKIRYPKISNVFPRRSFEGVIVMYATQYSTLRLKRNEFGNKRHYNLLVFIGLMDNNINDPLLPSRLDASKKEGSFF